MKCIHLWFFIGLFSSVQLQQADCPSVLLAHQISIFFTPDHDVRSRLVDLIDQERKSIKMACFRFTDKIVSKALSMAFHRGINVEIVADEGCLGGRFSKLRKLHQQGVFTYIYPAVGSSTVYTLMHNKFIIFESLESVWTGSMNFTSAGMEKNQENSCLFYNGAIATQYSVQFELLKNRSTCL